MELVRKPASATNSGELEQNTAQTVTGAKTFSGALTASSSLTVSGALTASGGILNTGLTGANATTATTTGSGMVGEVKTQNLSTNIGAGDNALYNAGSIAIGTGIWLVIGRAYFTSNNTMQNVLLALSTSSSAPTQDNNIISQSFFAPNGTFNGEITLNAQIYTVGTGQTVYGYVKCYRTSGTTTITGQLVAIRIA
jgi:hypothetical protein